MDKLMAMTVFAEVVGAGSFVKAADRLAISTTAVSRYVSDLEKHLGVRLMQRNTRSLSLTEDGQRFFDRSLDILAVVAEAEAEAAHSAQEPSGRLRVSVPLSLTVNCLLPHLAEFQRRYPKIELQLTASDRIVDLYSDPVDAALRVSRQFSEELIVRELMPVRMAISAAPSYLQRRGTPQTLEDLEQHDCLVYRGSAQPGVWSLMLHTGDLSFTEQRRVPVRLQSDNGDVLRGMAEEGLGLLLEPEFSVAKSYERGALVRVLPGWEAPQLVLAVAYPSRKLVSRRLRVFIDFWVEQCAQRPLWAKVFG